MILCADDYGLSAGVSQGILELATARRLSATSAIVTMDRWPEDAARLRAVRDRIAIGLHLNLTLGRSLGPMPKLAPDGVFPSLGAIVRSAIGGRVDRAEVEAEILRQIDRFVTETGFPPDHIDGHQHIQVLPVVRTALVASIDRRFAVLPPLVRTPTDTLQRMLGRQGELVKALGVATLSIGFAGMLKTHKIPTNEGFSGYSAFDEQTDYRIEFRRAAAAAGPMHIVMCHPGYPDAELSKLDPVVARRGQELEFLREAPELPDLIWHAERPIGGPPIVWNHSGVQ